MFPTKQDIIIGDKSFDRISLSKWRTFLSINNLMKFKSPKLSSWTLITFIVILSLALILESSTVSSLPTKSKSRRDHHSHNYYHHNHHHHHHHHHNRSSRHHHVKQPILEMHEPVADSSGSLSIVTPLDVLRQNMLAEMQKTRMRHAKNKVVEYNREYLEKIGRRRR